MSQQQKGESKGREDNAATADYPDVSEVTPQAYPAVNQREAAERTGRTEEVAGEGRTFDTATGNPKPRQGAGDSTPRLTETERPAGQENDPTRGDG